jgi:hypothetical protein
LRVELFKEARVKQYRRSLALVAWTAMLMVMACGGTNPRSPHDASGDAYDADRTDVSPNDANADTACAEAGTDAGDAGHVSDSGTDAGDAGLGSDAGTDAGTLDAGVVPPATVAWVMSYFGPQQDVAADSLHLAYSTDGLHWTALAPGAPAYEVSGIGTNHIRDPFVFRKNDGTFVYVATDWTLSNNDANYWNNPSSKIFVADSSDLITFTNPRLLRVTNANGPGGSAMHAWAPEIQYDPAHDAYAILWSGNDTSGENRIYVSYTGDFTSVSNANPEVLFDPGYSVIDATIVRGPARNYLFFKDETDNSGSPLTGSGKDIQVARSPAFDLVAGSFTRWSASYVTRGTNQGTRQATEGPFVIRDPDSGTYYLYADYYGNGGVFGCWSTTDLDSDPSTWTRLATDEYSLPAGVRHANTVRVTQAELDALVAHYGTARRIRSTYSEGGQPFYVAHSWYHGVIARKNEPSLASGDFEWRVVPGLSNPSDASLVTLVPASFPARALRIDSANESRYPPCGEASTYGWALCNVPAGQRHHLGWVDTQSAAPGFAADATFRIVPALNGNPSMVSLQWVPEPTRYLRHVSYQLFAATFDGSPTQANDASFTLE